MSAKANAIEKPMSRPKRPKRLGVKRIEIEKADGGYIRHTRYHTTPDSPYDEGDTQVHGDGDPMKKFLDQMFSGDSKNRRMSAAKTMLGRPSDE